MITNKSKVVILKNISKDALRVRTINGKEEIKAGDTFEILENKAKTLIRMYRAYFAVSDEATKVIPTTEDVIDVKKQEKVEATSELEDARAIYEEQKNVKVPNNKKNDLEWIKSKLD